MYSFTMFAMQLNELDKEIEEVIPKTDCRLRPDIRAMEKGDIGWLLLFYSALTFTFSHLADAFVQSDIQGRE